MLPSDSFGSHSKNLQEATPVVGQISKHLQGFTKHTNLKPHEEKCCRVQYGWKEFSGTPFCLDPIACHHVRYGSKIEVHHQKPVYCWHFRKTWPKSVSLLGSFRSDLFCMATVPVPKKTASVLGLQHLARQPWPAICSDLKIVYSVVVFCRTRFWFAGSLWL